jgi:hypothetical protein
MLVQKTIKISLTNVALTPTPKAFILAPALRSQKRTNRAKCRGGQSMWVRPGSKMNTQSPLRSRMPFDHLKQLHDGQKHFSNQHQGSFHQILD